MRPASTSRHTLQVVCHSCCPLQKNLPCSYCCAQHFKIGPPLRMNHAEDVSLAPVIVDCERVNLSQKLILPHSQLLQKKCCGIERHQESVATLGTVNIELEINTRRMCFYRRDDHLAILLGRQLAGY